MSGYKPIITENDKQEVLFALRQFTSADQRIPVEELCKSMGISRRKLRFIVHEINSDDTDHLVLTDTDNGGYWLAVRGADPEPAVRYYLEERSRELSLRKKNNAAERKINRIYGKGAIDPAAKLQDGLF